MWWIRGGGCGGGSSWRVGIVMVVELWSALICVAEGSVYSRNIRLTQVCI